MLVIRDLEREARGWYTGCLGWWDPKAGQADSNLLIRSIFMKDGRAYWQVGAGVVADSLPAKEWAETLAKAKGLERALFWSQRG
jgi:anthranilate/para-aminobenzoate synthase component I